MEKLMLVRHNQFLESQSYYYLFQFVFFLGFYDE